MAVGHGTQSLGEPGSLFCSYFVVNQGGQHAMTRSQLLGGMLDVLLRSSGQPSTTRFGCCLLFSSIRDSLSTGRWADHSAMACQGGFHALFGEPRVAGAHPLCQCYLESFESLQLPCSLRKAHK